VQRTQGNRPLAFVITLIFASLIYVGFGQFAGNATTVRHLREAIAAERMPPALILAGPRGAGKYTLAIMLAQTMACLEHPVSDGLPDFCGVCSNCTRIGQSQPLAERVSEAIAAREELREVDKKETRVLVQTHPDVVVIPPDPPQLLIKIGQVRSVMQHLYRLPADAPRAVYIFTSTAFMKEAANSLLKILEEPPTYAHIFLLAETRESSCSRSVPAPAFFAWGRCRRSRSKHCWLSAAEIGNRNSVR
jgi:DNA polymerase III subunit delta'